MHENERWSAAGAFVVFGGTGGIGGAVVQALADHGARVLVAARRPERAGTGSRRDGVEPFACDVTEPGAVEAALQQAAAIADGAPPAGVALCVGSILLKPAHLTTDEEWDQVLAVNLSAAFRIARAAGKTMRSGGSVVFCSTAAAAVGLPNHDAIAAAKAGIEGLARSAAATYAARGLRFSCVAPGLVDTELAAAITGNERALATSRAMHPLGRIGVPADVASAIVWLLDPANTWTSGSVLRVDGGLAQLRSAPRA